MATVVDEARRTSAKEALHQTIDEAIDKAAEKMGRRRFRKAIKGFKEVLSRGASSHRRKRESA